MTRTRVEAAAAAAAATTAAAPPLSAFPPVIANDEQDLSCERDEARTCTTTNSTTRSRSPASLDADPDCLHDLHPGDHIVRWTHIALYPIQVHGIVLSSGPGLVSLVDFGISSQSKEADQKRFGPTDGPDSRTTGSTSSAADTVAEDGHSTDREASEVDKAAGGCDRRLEIITLTEEKDISKWKRVDYGTVLGGDNRFKRLVSSILPSKERTNVNGRGERNDTAESQSNALESTVANDPKRESACNKKTTIQKDEVHQVAPTLPKSDPKGVVLARVRYLLEHEGLDEKGRHRNTVLPPYHLFNANSECIAVWCKTGRFSTLQASIFLYSTAIGQAKSAATLSLFVASQTVTATVPASGILGWFGATTTSTIPLLTACPWLIPALAGYGLAAVGTPYLVLVKARGRWEESTKLLNDGFWAWADTDVYVDAIRGWGGLCLGDDAVGDNSRICSATL